MQEEQRVIEAKIRMRQQEIQDEEERMLKRQELGYSGGNMSPVGVEYSSVAGLFPFWSLCVCYFNMVCDCIIIVYLFSILQFHLLGLLSKVRKLLLH